MIEPSLIDFINGDGVSIIMKFRDMGILRRFTGTYVIGKMGNKIRYSLVIQTNLRNLSFFMFVRFFSLSSIREAVKNILLLNLVKKELLEIA